MKVKRVYVEKRAGFDIEAQKLKTDLADFLGRKFPPLAQIEGLRILNRYDVSGPNKAQFEKIVKRVFSEGQCDEVFYSDIPIKPGDSSFAVEYLPGQYNQRSDSARQCAELVVSAQILVRQAVVYILTPGGIPLSDTELSAVKNYLINPVDSREAPEELPASLVETYPSPEETPVVNGFISKEIPLDEVVSSYDLAMNILDLEFCRSYFSSVGRDPTLAELRVLDTYWSDHCRHTTFNAVLENVQVDEGSLKPDLQKALAIYEAVRKEVYDTEPLADENPRSLMDIAVIGAKALKKRGLVTDIDSSAEINACTIKVDAEFSDESSEPWLFLFKNETHNHPTEIEPFGGAATCLGGAIRDPLSGRAYAHQSMRVTGGADPHIRLDETLPGKLPQIKIARDAAGGFSSYGNQIGLATGQVAEFYHPGFLAKRMELGAVIAAAPASSVRREEPTPGDLVLLVGGRTGRDGIGGATGSSKIHSGESVESAGAEVQKGNAVEERKLQRLFRNPEVALLIKRCNDFGAGGVAVAVGELAAGVDIDLDKVSKKYAGLDGIELAISESQERMAVVVSASDADAFIGAAAQENLDATVIAAVTAGSEDHDATLRMKWQGKTIIELSREFLNSNGALRFARALLPANIEPSTDENIWQTMSGTADIEQLSEALECEMMSLRSCSRRGLQERFDGSIGAGSVLFPFGGSSQGTPECGMASLFPSLDKKSLTASLMTFGYDPFIMEQNPYAGAKGSIREALAKYACLGGNPWKARLSLQEYFGRPQTPETWGKPTAAMLGALEAQLALGVPAIGGKDSMSGNYCDFNNAIDITVPPTLVAFAAGVCRAEQVRSGSLSGKEGNLIILFSQKLRDTASADNRAHDEWELYRKNINALVALGEVGCVCSAYPVGPGGIAVSLALMAFGNMVGVEADSSALAIDLGSAYQGSVLAEINADDFNCDPEIREILDTAGNWSIVGMTTAEPSFCIADVKSGTDARCNVMLAALRDAWESPLSKVYPRVSGIKGSDEQHELLTALSALNCVKPGSSPGSASRSPSAAPLVVLPVFPGTNCEWDMERAFRNAGARTQIIVFRNRSSDEIAASLDELAKAIKGAQILALSGGFSAGDEPDGSGKYIANVLRSPSVSDAVGNLLEKNNGLILGICNGFQALIKTGLVPYGTFRDADDSMPTLTFNRLGRHVSRMAHTRVMSCLSPWLALEEPNAVHIIPVSHGEGRVAMLPEEASWLFENGQIPFCYVDPKGQPSLKEPDNPNGSDFAIEGISSPDGRILGKMCHSERCGDFVHINIPGNKKQNIFEAGVGYFR